MLTSHIVFTNGARVRNLLGRVHKCEHTRFPAFWRGDRVKVQCRTCRDILGDSLDFVLRHWSKHHFPFCMLFPFVATSFERIPLLCIPITHYCTYVSKWVNWRKCVHSDISRPICRDPLTADNCVHEKILGNTRNGCRKLLINLGRISQPDQSAQGLTKAPLCVPIPRQECLGTKCEHSDSCFDALDTRKLLINLGRISQPDQSAQGLTKAPLCVPIPRQECSGTKCEHSDSCFDALDNSSEPCWFHLV